jgi:hypothetical protein
MKNTIKWVGLIAVAAIIGFSFTSCAEEEVEKTIVITGIPDTYSGKYGSVGLFDYNALVNAKTEAQAIAALKALSQNRPISSSGKVTLPLFDQKANLWTGSGKFAILFSITADSNAYSENLFSGIILSKSITDEVTTISFGSFDDAWEDD